MKLGVELEIDSVNLYWRAEAIHERGHLGESRREEAQLIAVFVSICAWFESLHMFEGNWLDAIREGISAAV